ncbi:hypothetical protein [Candidatus Cyanaurora vandensis]|uniref:hypothetical protein n=1 Tax=Candidatus Cyanaurora vandensis TaxID=2714958 RepID=UPI00257AF273|nr:hypothetical protein [Candidatus Cyanaurora vandensis]
MAHDNYNVVSPVSHGEPETYQNLVFRVILPVEKLGKTVEKLWKTWGTSRGFFHSSPQAVENFIFIHRVFHRVVENMILAGKGFQRLLTVSTDSTTTTIRNIFLL